MTSEPDVLARCKEALPKKTLDWYGSTTRPAGITLSELAALISLCESLKAEVERLKNHYSAIAYDQVKSERDAALAKVEELEKERVGFVHMGFDYKTCLDRLARAEEALREIMEHSVGAYHDIARAALGEDGKDGN